jgi:hypothetical protein
MGVGGLQFNQSSLKAESVELIDGKHANAARRASGLADEPFTAAALGAGQSGVEDLYQLLVLMWKQTQHELQIIA